MSRFLILIVSLLLLASCGSGSDTFLLEGRLTKIRQADFFIYSPDGGISGRDTIKVMDGRFAYETIIDDEKTFIIVFPNHSEHPIFAEPGAEVTISGTAAQLKLMEIEGTDDNELYTDFRTKTAEMSDSETMAEVENFIAENPQSAVCRFLIDRYFIKTQTPNYKKAIELIDIILKSDPDNPRIMLLRKQLEGLKENETGSKISSFTAITIKGDTISNDSLNAIVNVVNVYASWNSTSQVLQSTLKRYKRQYGDSLAVMSICLDADSLKCVKLSNGDPSGIHIICDKKVWDSPTLHDLGISTIPGNIITDKNGKILATNLETKALDSKLKELLQK